jgi:hypothetical protein
LPYAPNTTRECFLSSSGYLPHILCGLEASNFPQRWL